MATKTTSQKHAELKDLAKRTKDNIFAMLKLANEILSDHEYVDSLGGEDQVLERLEAEEFSHFGGSPSVSEMVRAYRKNPDRATWNQYHHNVWALIELANPSAEGAAIERINWKAKCKELEAQLAQTAGALAEYRSMAADLRTKCDDLMASNGELRGRVSVLEKYAPRQAVA